MGTSKLQGDLIGHPGVEDGILGSSDNTCIKESGSPEKLRLHTSIDPVFFRILNGTGFLILMNENSSLSFSQ